MAMAVSGIGASVQQQWDHQAIIAEVRRRGYSLARLSDEAGLYPNACAQGLRGLSWKGAKAVSDFLGVPMSELFPGYYLRRVRREDDSANNSAKATQKTAHRGLKG